MLQRITKSLPGGDQNAAEDEEGHTPFIEQLETPVVLKGQSHEKVGEMSVWCISLGPN
jgi:hypothetical protein